MRLEFESNVSSVPFSENELAENVAETSSAHTSELLREGIKAAQAGNRAVARVLLLNVTETDPHNENAWLWLASISEYPEELIIFLNNVLEVNPENARAKEWMAQTKSLLAKTFVQRGIDASKEGQNDFAKQCFYQAAAHDDANEMAWLWLASISDNTEEKLIHLNKALHINPENADAQNALGAVEQEMANNLLQKAVSAVEAGDRTTAAELLKEVFLKSPAMEEAWMLKAQISEDASEKIHYYERVLEINAENEAAHDALHTIHQQQTRTLLQNAKSAAFAGDSRTANEMLAEILEKSPAVEEAWMLKSLLALGFDEKMSCFEKVLEINPENEAAKSGLNTLRAFMPAIETGKDEYSQMAEEFAEEEIFEEEVFEETSAQADFREEFQPEEFQPEEFQSNEEEAHLADESDSEKELQAASNFEESAQSHQLPEAETANSVSEIYELKTADAVAPEWSIDETETASESPELTEEPETEESAAPAAEVKFVDFGFDKFEEVAGETETLEKSEISAAADFAEAGEESFEPQAADFDPQPTHFFDKPADHLHYEEFAFQTLPEPQSEDVQPQFESPAPPAAEMFSAAEFAPAAAQDFLPEPVQEFSHFSNETFEGNHQKVSYNETFENNNFSNLSSFAEQNLSPAVIELPAQTEEVFEENAAESFPEVLETAAATTAASEGFSCPFCNVENDAQTFACDSCGAVLSLSDLEMLLANQNTDRAMLQNTVDRMELEKTERTFGEYELMFLGIGHINLKNLRQGFSYLQQASQLNPNNVVLASQVNALAIRADEIERQEEIHESLPKGRTILVVDDSPTVRKLISGKLEKSGHEVFCAVDGMDALAKLGEIVPDLILLDITMPRMDGYQVCKMIRNNEETKDIPVVMISGKDGFFDKVRGRMAGRTGYITKPFGPETLMKALDIYIKTDEDSNSDNSLLSEA